MVSEFARLISFNDLYSQSTDNFLKSFEDVIDPNIKNGLQVPFELYEKERKNKLNPIIKLANSDDASDILKIYFDIYKGTYPYKEMEDINEISNMIKDPKYHWLLFKDKKENTVGCFTYELDFNQKKGYMRGFNILRNHQGKLDAVKAVIGSMIGVWSEYKHKINLWYCENRTAHTKSQYLSCICGIKPIAFLPNKDLFFGRTESDIMHIIYDHMFFKKYRSNKIAKIIPTLIPLFNFVNRRYPLGDYRVIKDKIKFNSIYLNKIKQKIQIKVKKIKFSNYAITIKIQDTQAYLQFLLRPNLRIIEKISYFANNIDDFKILINKLMDIFEKFRFRYLEIFIPAYQAYFQKLLINSEFTAIGYIPGWNYNEKTHEFEDFIIFCKYNGKLKNVNLLEESKLLVKKIGIEIY